MNMYSSPLFGSLIAQFLSGFRKDGADSLSLFLSLREPFSAYICECV